MFKQKRFVLMILCILSISAICSAKEIVESKVINNKKVNLVILPISEFEFKVGRANDKNVGSESFSSMINRYNPVAAINANFFNAYSKTEEGKLPYGAIIKDGVFMNNGGGAAFIATDTNIKIKQIKWLEPNSSLSKIEKGIRYVDEDSPDKIEEYIETLVSGDPLLIKNGKNVANQYGSAMESKISSQSAQRSAIGITWDAKVVFLTANSVTTDELAKILLTLGCRDAINVDGGASSALYAGGKVLQSPGRNLNTLLLAQRRTLGNDVIAYADNISVKPKNTNSGYESDNKNLISYKINGFSYVNVDELALALSKSQEQFGIITENTKINLLPGHIYRGVFKEKEPEIKSVLAKPIIQRFFVSKTGKFFVAKGYIIKNKKYFKLDKLIEILNLNALYNGSDVTVSY